MKVEIGQDEDWETIESKLPRNFADIGVEHGILTEDLRRSRGASSGWKIRDHSALLRMILHHVSTGSALRTTTALAAALGLANISAVALHKWMRKCGPWLAALVSEMIATDDIVVLRRAMGGLRSDRGRRDDDSDARRDEDHGARALRAAPGRPVRGVHQGHERQGRRVAAELRSS